MAKKWIQQQIHTAQQLFYSFNTGPLRAAQQKEQHPCGHTWGSLLLAIQHVSRGGGGAFVSQQDPAPHLQPFLIYRLFIRHSELQRTFTSSQERRLNNPPGHLPSGCCVPWSVVFFAQPAFSFSGRVTGEAQKEKKKSQAKKLELVENFKALETQSDKKYGRDVWAKNNYIYIYILSNWGTVVTDHFLWSCFLHWWNSLFLKVLINLLFVNGVNWNTPP